MDAFTPDRATRNARAAFFRLLMRLDMRYTIYEHDIVVVEVPKGDDLYVVDLSTGRVETVGP